MPDELPMRPPPAVRSLRSSPRFVERWEHLARPFGSDAFGARAEAFARFFGTPRFLLGQSAVVGTWILVNAVGLVRFDVYPFILLNLAFSLQAAYAAPLILLAATRQADRDKAQAADDAAHREGLAREAARQRETEEHQIGLITKILEENTRLTARVEALTEEIHLSVVAAASASTRDGNQPSSPAGVADGRRPARNVHEED